MSERQKIQDSELSSVSGGETSENGIRIKCLHCYHQFLTSETEYKRVSDRCGTYDLYLCKHCGSWVETSGKPYV